MRTVFTATTLLVCAVGCLHIATSRPLWRRVMTWGRLRRLMVAAVVMGLGLLASTPLSHAIADQRDSSRLTYVIAAALFLVPATALTVGCLRFLGEPWATCLVSALLLAVAPLPSRGLVGECARVVAIALFLVASMGTSTRTPRHMNRKLALD